MSAELSDRLTDKEEVQSGIKRKGGFALAPEGSTERVFRADSRQQKRT